MDKLTEIIHELESRIPYHEKTNPEVSVSSAGWHIEHSLLTVNNIIRALQSSDPQKYKWKFNPTRTLVFVMNRIPRGRAKSPEIVQPKGNLNSDTLNEHFKITGEKLRILENLNSGNFFDHPFFGRLNLKPTVKFLIIHTKHHLDIIDDIIR
ncbi:MAG TPA: hypothetical protein PKA90_07430 [Ignavibacteria bacterium]|nr:hypothetical protein [Ignavibacteria bacterium]HMR40247.1 hypothetical protein [Ignavibacteria bacterium]